MDYKELLDKYDQLEADFLELVMESEYICKFCKHNFECKGKECDKYTEGKGYWDANKCYYDWDWSCRDFHFGTCDMLENTPCNGCFDNNNKGFEWRGSIWLNTKIIVAAVRFPHILVLAMLVQM